jgi:hypothetical protein
MFEHYAMLSTLITRISWLAQTSRDVPVVSLRRPGQQGQNALGMGPRTLQYNL